MLEEDEGILLHLCEAFKAHNERVRDAHRDVHQLMLEEKWRIAMRTRHYLTSRCLDAPCESAWMTLYMHGSDVNFLNATSLTRGAFHQLLSRFASFYDLPPPSSRGRPPKLRYLHQVLGLVLSFYVGSMEQSSLCIMFGVPPSPLSRTLRRAEEALSLALTGYAPARISWPSPLRQAELARMVNKREPLLTHTFGFIDGKTYVISQLTEFDRDVSGQVQQPSNADLQNAMYNGWLHSVFVTGTICFAADGCIIWSKHNCPGSWNDSDTSLEFRNKLTDPQLCPDERMSVVSDSAFPCSTAMTGRILTPLMNGDIERIEPCLRSAARTLHNAITSIQQAAEWGMGSVQKAYSRLNLPLPYDPDLRGIRLNNLFRMANYRVRAVGISEIKTTFVGVMEMPNQDMFESL